MIQTLIRILLFCTGCCLQFSANAQTIIYPGDINNNGVVSGIDLLYIGTALDATGDVRPNASLDFVGQQTDILWTNEFPGGINYAHADADGDGVITENDLLGGILGNIKKTHGTVGNEGYLNGVPGIDPTLLIIPMSSVAYTGSSFGFDLNLGDAAFPINQFYGISFTVSLDYDILAPNSGVDFTVPSDSWVDTTGVNHRKIATLLEDGSIEFAFTRINKVPTGGNGHIANFFVIIEDIIDDLPADTITITINDIRLTDENLTTYPIATSSAQFQLAQASATNPPSSNCPDIVAPVCGSNGVTYLNSCFALEAGVTDFTPGVCFSDCIDPALINPNTVCSTVYDPVCGCNDVTYMNACEADKAGVTEYTSGACNTSSCYNPQQVVSNGYTNVDPDNGIITVNCTTDAESVCGCDGITYASACLAEASGITFYTVGDCGLCVDPWTMNPDATCTYDYEPVCGCNNETYLNACQATAAGITNFTNGVCGAASTWCNEAIPIQCGDYLPFETTVGAGNDISFYQNCLNTTMVGPDKVYVINKNTPGDLQIGLEITTSGLDLDLFLLDENCNAVTCLGASHTDNSQTNNEGILYEDAPIGVYYIVVDGQYADSEGDYRLEVSCAYLDCTDAVALTCGQPFNGNNLNGNDNVSLYHCGNVLNVENNGPEVVHTFTITEPGQVDISLTDLAANLELFLLDACDNSACLRYSQNGGTNSEYISTFLNAGTYYIVVDGYNGATSDYTLQVDCDDACDLSVSVNASNADCDDNNGSITVFTSGGEAPFIIEWAGAASGNLATYQPTTIIPNLPGGLYTISVTDANGCIVTQTQNVAAAGGLDLTLNPVVLGCGGEGGITLIVNNGSPAYQAVLTGPVSESVIFFDNSYSFSNLPAGDYSVLLKDSNGCQASGNVTVVPSNIGLNFSAAPTAATCDELGFIAIEVANGTLPYTVQITGTVNGSGIANDDNFTIQNLPGGSYTIAITDANGCASVQQVVVPNFALDISAIAFNGVCGQNGSISVSVNSGTPDYQLTWSGPVGGTATNTSGNFILPNLPTGTYELAVVDGADCEDVQLIYLDNSAPTLDVDVNTVDADCDETGFIFLNFNDGQAPYAISWSGPTTGNSSATSSIFQITGALAGNYNLSITDANGCTYTESVTVEGGAAVSFSATPVTTDCGQNGNIDVQIFSGEAPFSIQWSGPSTGNQTVNAFNYTIENLTSGTYTVNISDANGCTDSQQLTINTTNTLTFTATPNPGDCGQNGTISVNIAGGNGNYEVSWNGPVAGAFNTAGTAFLIPNLPSGTYNIEVEDTDGCGAWQTVQLINGNGALSANLTANSGTCSQNGSIDLQITAGQAPFWIEYTGPSSGAQGGFDPNFSFSNLTPGNYIFTIEGGDGCEIMQSVFLSAGTGMTFTATPNSGTCDQFGNIDLAISGGTAPYTISWAGPTSSSTTINGNNYTIPNLFAGNYTINISDNAGCSIQQTIHLDNGDNVEFWLTAIPGGCGELGEIAVEIGQGVAPFTISWSGLSSGSTTTFDPLFTISNLPSDNYTITVFDAVSCGNTGSVNVNNANNLNLGITENNGICGQNGSLTLNFSGGTAPYSISYSGAASGNFNTNGNAAIIPNLPSGNYNVVVTSNDGCIVSGQANLDNGNGGIAIWAIPINGTCGQNGAVNVDVTGGTGPFTYSWSGTANGSIIQGSSVYTIPNLPNGSYTVSVTDSNGCSDVVAATVNSAGGIEIWATPVDGVCGQNGSINVDVTGGTGPFVYAWSGPISNSIQQGSSVYTIPNLPNGNYTVTVTDANGCTDIETAIVTSTAGTTLWATANNGTCGQLGSISLDFSGGNAPFSINWTGPTNGNQLVNGNNFIINNVQSGTYTITSTNADGCAASQTVTVNNANNISFWATANDGTCGATGSITINLSGGQSPYQLTWSGTANGTITITTNTYTINNLPSGNYNLMLTDASGCSANQSVMLDNGNDIVFTTNVQNGTCGNTGSAIVNIIGGTAPYSVSWTGGAGNGTNVTNGNFYTIQNLISGALSISITDAEGCSAQNSVNISNGTTLLFSATPVNGVCGNAGQINLNFSNGNAPYNISWSGTTTGSQTANNSNATLTNLPTGTYTINVSDATNCAGNTTVFVSNSSAVTVNVTGSNTVCNGANTGSATANPNGGTAPYSYSWSNGGTTQTISNLSGGTYTVTVLDVNNCTATSSIAINQSTPITIDLATNEITCNGANDGGILAVGWGGAPPYTYEWSTGLIYTEPTPNAGSNLTNLTPGTYTVTVTDQNNCETIHAIGLDEPDVLALPTTFTNATCNNNDGSATVNPTGGTPPYSYQWSNGGLGQSIFNVAAGTYTVQVFDANFCTETASVIVGADNSNTVAGFTFTQNDLTFNFTNTSTNATTFSWDFGDTNTANTSNANHTYSAPGTYTICLTTTNSCNSDTHCQTVTATMPQNAAIIDVGEVAGADGEVLSIPVSISGLSELTSFAGSIELGDPTMTTIMGLAPAAILPSFNPALNTFSFFSSNGMGMPVVNNEILFYIEVQITGNPGDQSPVMLVDNPLPIEVGTIQNNVPVIYPHFVSQGMASISTQTPAKISGNIKTWQNEGINNVGVDVWNDGFSDVFLTDEEGNYETNALIAGEEFYVEPWKDTLPANGLSTFGLFVGQQWILGHNPPQITSPYQLIAGDANCNNSFSTLDLFAIQQLIIGNSTAFDNCPSWIFIPEGYPMTMQTAFPFPEIDSIFVTGDTVANFVGVKKGDILGDANPANLLAADDRSGEFVLQAKNRVVKAGEIVELTLNNKEIREIAALQLALKYDNSKFEFLTTQAAKLENPLSAPFDSEIRLTWFDLTGEGVILEEKAGLFTFQFRALTNVDDLESAFDFGNEKMRSIAFASDGNAYNLALEFAKENISVEGFALYQNVPNPFGETTQIPFDLPNAAQVKLTIQNSRGEVVRVMQDDFAKGRNQFVFEKGKLSGGVYYYTIETGEIMETRRMVIL